MGVEAAVAGGVLGAVAGSQKDKTSTTNASTSNVNLRDFQDLIRGAGGREQGGAALAADLMRQQQRLTELGPGAADVSAAANRQRDFEGMLRAAGAQGGFAQQGDIQQAQQFAQQVFAPQREMLSQQFEDQEIQQKRLAAQLGRPVNDPVLRSMLARDQGRQMASLAAQQGAFGAEQAQAAVGRRLQLAGQAAQIRSGLATQAFQNRSALAQLGRQITQDERNFRLGTASQTRTGIQETLSGGGVGGAIAGAIGGASTFAGAAGKFGGFSGASGGSAGAGGVAMGGPAASAARFGSMA